MTSKTSRAATPQRGGSPYTETRSEATMASMDDLMSIVALLALQQVFLDGSENIVQCGTGGIIARPNSFMGDPWSTTVGNFAGLEKTTS